MTKREEWEWIKKNAPDMAKLLLEINEAFGKPTVKLVIHER